MSIENRKDNWLEKRKEEMLKRHNDLLEKLNTKPEVKSPDAPRMAELRHAVQLFLSTMDADTQLEDMMAVATVFPVYAVGKAYKVKEVFSYGENGVGDPQLYQVLQAHTSTEEWKPDATPSLYKKIGVTEDGYPEWVQPLGASDAYNTGDVVSYNGKVYRSLMDANVYSPDAYPAGWEVVN